MKERVIGDKIFRDAEPPFDYCGRMGRSSVRVKCAFCEFVFIAYCWSLAGSGKRCPKCGAVRSYGYSSRPA